MLEKRTNEKKGECSIYLYPFGSETEQKTKKRATRNTELHKKGERNHSFKDEFLRALSGYLNKAAVKMKGPFQLFRNFILHLRLLNHCEVTSGSGFPSRLQSILTIVLHY